MMGLMKAQGYCHQRLEPLHSAFSAKCSCIYCMRNVAINTCYKFVVICGLDPAKTPPRPNILSLLWHYTHEYFDIILLIDVLFDNQKPVMFLCFAANYYG